MKLNIFFKTAFVSSVVAVSCLVAQVEQRPAFPKKLSLAEAKKIALQDNPDLQVTLARINQALAKIDAAQSFYLPTVDFNASGQRQIDTARQNRRTAHRDAYSSFGVSLDATWTVYEGLARKFQLMAEKLGQNIAEHNHEDAQRQLLLAVASAYYTALLERQNVIIAVDDYMYNKKLQENAEKKLRHGTGTKSDVLNFEIQAKNADADRVMSELNYHSAILALSELLYVDPSTVPANPVDCMKNLELDPVDDYLKAPAIKSFAELSEYAIENRPDLKSAKQAILMHEALASVQKGGFHPIVEAFGSYGFSRDHNLSFNSVNDEAVIGLRLSWNIFNGNRTRAQIAQEVANRMEQEANAKAIRSKILNDIASQITIIEQAKRLADLKNETQVLAKQARDLVQKEYDNGRVTATRLNEAQTDLTNAQGAYIKAVINYWLYRQNLDATTSQILDVK